jgi:tRNA (guanine-N7-)-methyltransferase
MGMEIRSKVVNFVGEKVRAIRSQSNFEQCMNASVVRTNTMKHLLQVYGTHPTQQVLP